MKLYLVQHGNSLSKEEDPECPLSPQGERDVGNVAHFLESAGITVRKIFHSGKKRAEQTAQILCNTIGTNSIEMMEGIKPMSDVEPIITQVKDRV